MNRKLQIGVMGSAADLDYSQDLEKMAFEIGKEIAKSGHFLVYGAEKDYDSLSAIAARGAKSVNGQVIGVTYGSKKGVLNENQNGIIIGTGLDRGGGREFVLVNSCDVLILISGGSGTLTEAAIAYQLNIPIIALQGSGGWADKLAETYLDARKRIRVEAAQSPKEAVQLAITLAQ